MNDNYITFKELEEITGVPKLTIMKNAHLLAEMGDKLLEKMKDG